MRTALPVATLLLLGPCLPAIAAPMLEPKHSVYGCLDPRATTALAIPDGRLRNHKWVEYVHRTGRCVVLPAGQPLAVITHQGPLVLVKPQGGAADAPAVYAQSGDMSEIAETTVPAEPLPASVPTAPPTSVSPAPVTTAAEPPTPVPSESPSQTQTPTPVEAPIAAAPAAPVQSGPAAADTSAPAGDASSAPAAQPAASGQPANNDAPPAQAPAEPPPAANPSAPVAPSPAAAPVTTATPEPVPAENRSSGSSLLVVLVVLALLGLIAAAVLVARQRRRFAHVEDSNWQEPDSHLDPLDRPAPVSQVFAPEPSPQSYRKACVDVLEQGGWIIQPSFAAGADRDGAPDILGRRRDAILAVRCRGGHSTVTPEIIDEVASMGQQARAHVTVLVTPAPLTRRAHDEAMRLHVHVLDQDELASLSA